jgi:hypothetical protein
VCPKLPIGGHAGNSLVAGAQGDGEQEVENMGRHGHEKMQSVKEKKVAEGQQEGNI